MNMGVYCISCKNKECPNHNKDIYFGWDCKKYFNNVYTNADHMRGMSDEKLAEWLVYKVKCTGCNAENCNEEFCINLMKEWIKYPCKE